MDFSRAALLCAIPGVGAFGNYVFASQANARFMEGHTASNIIGFGAQAVGSFALFHALISGDSTSLYVGLGMMGVSAVAAGAASVALHRPA
jgi:heme/copper-type cytochrome/quinol oxidase subunit 1